MGGSEWLSYEALRLGQLKIHKIFIGPRDDEHHNQEGTTFE